MRTLLVLTAVLEASAGAAFLAAPALVVDLLLGVPLDTPAGWVFVRLAGVALLALATACWCASRDVPSRAATGVVAAMLLYNLGVAALLVYCGCCADMKGFGLWPGVALHGALAVGCVTRLIR